MSYSFAPLSDAELSSFPILPPGVYDFEVLKSTRKVSSSGNDMCEVNLCIWDKEGKTSSLFDYLVFSTVPLNIRKIKHFCDAVGLADNYKRGELPESLQGLSGKVQIGVKDEQPKNDGNGYWPKKNIVEDYVMTDKGAVKYERPTVANSFEKKPLSRTDQELAADQDVPF